MAKINLFNLSIRFYVAAGGDGTNEWNLNGTRLDDPILTSLTIDNSGFVNTTGNNGYGTLISSGVVTIGSQNLQVTSTYELLELEHYIKITTRITNISGTDVTNLRYWVGTRDDYVGGTDSPTKERGNLVDGAFELLSNSAYRASALKITTSTEGILFYTDTDRGNTYIRNGYSSWSNIPLQDPSTSVISRSGDDSYAFYVRMNDLADGEYDEFTWYYGAGEIADLNDIISDIASAVGAVSDLLCDAGTYTAKVSADATGYWVLVNGGETAPTEAQIKAGVDYSEVTVIANGSSAMLADVEVDFPLSGLTLNTDYDLYFVAEDAVPQFTAIVKTSFTSYNDNVNPVTPTLSDVTGECSATVAVTPTTTDECAGTITGTTTDDLFYDTQGTHSITWNFDDGNGNSIDVIQNVIIDDITAPVPDVATLSDVTAECSVTSLTAPTATDNCAGSVTVTNDASLPITAQGTTVVTWTYDDGNGNTSTQTQNVVIDDITAPVTPTLTTVTGECSVTVSATTTTDNCAGTITGTTSDDLYYDVQGTYTITWNFNDGNGNSIDVEQTVVVNDVTAPVTPTLSTVTGECSATVSAPTTNDACAGTITGTTADDLFYDAQGTYTITWNFDDGNGNSIDVIQNVVIDDITAPVPDVATLSDITAECSVASLTAPTATDNCAGSVTVTNDASLPITAQGTTVVTWTYDDGNGNTSTQTQNVVIEDVTAPITPTLTTITGECSVTVSAPTPTTTDNCAGIITGTTSDDLFYDVQGTYSITWNFYDGNGNSIDVIQNVVIEDVTAPITPTLSTITGECSATVTAPTTTDNCAGTITGTTSDDLYYDVQGTYSITWNFDDGNGNSIDVIQTVIVDDNTAPVPDIATLSDIIGECSATVTFTPTATDACTGAITGTTTDDLYYDAQGTYTITWTFDDENGNTSTQTQNVVIDDITAPVADAVSLDDLFGECSVDEPTHPTATDNCQGTITATTTTTFPTGTGTIIWIFDDGNGNVSTQEQQILVDDVTAPVADAACLDDLLGECSVDEPTAPTATDNCSGVITGISDITFPITTQGTYTVTWTFEDLSGNISTQTQNVIIADVTNPTITCVDNQEITADDTHTYTVQGTEFDPTETSDNCDVASLTNNFNNTATLDGATLPEGTTTIVWTVTDIAGNTTTCEYDVLVNNYVGISDLSEFGISIYPNPTSGIVNLNFDKTDNFTVTITDVAGKTIYQSDFNTSNAQIDISNQANGIYFINIINETSFTTAKLSKNKPKYYTFPKFKIFGKVFLNKKQ